jgi:hypothetical protein
MYWCSFDLAQFQRHPLGRSNVCKGSLYAIGCQIAFQFDVSLSKLAQLDFELHNPRLMFMQLLYLALDRFGYIGFVCIADLSGGHFR